MPEGDRGRRVASLMVQSRGEEEEVLRYSFSIANQITPGSQVELRLCLKACFGRSG